MALFTESSVRACIRVKDGRRVFYLGPGDRLTPSAREWLRQERIDADGYCGRRYRPVPLPEGKPSRLPVR